MKRESRDSDIAWKKNLQAGNPFFETCIYHNTNPPPGLL